MIPNKVYHKTQEQVSKKSSFFYPNQLALELNILLNLCACRDSLPLLKREYFITPLGQDRKSVV